MQKSLSLELLQSVSFSANPTKCKGIHARRESNSGNSYNRQFKKTEEVEIATIKLCFALFHKYDVNIDIAI